MQRKESFLPLSFSLFYLFFADMRCDDYTQLNYFYIKIYGLSKLEILINLPLFFSLHKGCSLVWFSAFVAIFMDSLIFACILII